MKQAKMEKRERIAQILDAALKLAAAKGGHYAHLTRDAIATEAGVSFALVTIHMGTMIDVRRAIMREAVQRECLPVIAQGLVARDPHARKAPAVLQDKAIHSIAG